MEKLMSLPEGPTLLVNVVVLVEVGRVRAYELLRVC